MSTNLTYHLKPGPLHSSRRGRDLPPLQPTRRRHGATIKDSVRTAEMMVIAQIRGIKCHNCVWRFKGFIPSSFPPPLNCHSHSKILTKRRGFPFEILCRDVCGLQFWEVNIRDAHTRHLMASQESPEGDNGQERVRMECTRVILIAEENKEVSFRQFEVDSKNAELFDIILLFFCEG